MRTRSLALGCAALVAACSSEARVTLVLASPERAAVDPLADTRLATLRLVDDLTGAPLGEASVAAGEELRIAQLPPQELDLRVEALAQNGQLLGLGRSRGVRLDTSRSDTVELALRRAFGLVAGGGDTELLDPAGIGGATTLARLELGSVRAAAGTSDGLSLALAQGGAVALVDTGQLAELGRTPLGGDARALVMSPDDALVAALLPDRVVLLPTGAIGGAFPENGPPAARLPAPTAAAFTAEGDALWVVTGAADCAGGAPQVLHRLEAATGADTAQAPLGLVISDLALAPSGQLLGAAPCAGKVVALGPDGAPASELATLAGATDLAVAGAQLVAAGGGRLTGPASLLVSGLGSGEVHEVRFDPPRFQGSLSDPQSRDRVDTFVAATEMQTRDLAISPDGRTALLHARFRYVSQFRAVDDLCVASVDATAEGVWAIDLASGAVAAERRANEQVARCELACGPPELPPLFTIGCQGRPVDRPFQPQAVFFLFGGT